MFSLVIPCVRSIINLFPALVTDSIVRIQILLWNASLGGSLSGTLIICLHTFLAVKFPIRFRDGFTVKVASALVAVEWIILVIVFLIGALTSTIRYENDGKFAGVDLLPVLGRFRPFMIVVHLLLLLFFQVSTVAELRKRRATVHNQQPQGNPITAAAQGRLDALSKTVVIVSIITGLTLIAWLPTLILFPISQFCTHCGIKKIHVAAIGSVCFLPNLLGNVVIYFIKSKEFKKVICTICKSNQVNPQDPQV